MGLNNDENITTDVTRNDKDETMDETRNDENKIGSKVNEVPKVRRSTRPRKQRMDFNQEEIGDCDDKNDPDYR